MHEDQTNYTKRLQNKAWTKDCLAFKNTKVDLQLYSYMLRKLSCGFYKT